MLRIVWGCCSRYGVRAWQPRLTPSKQRIWTSSVTTTSITPASSAAQPRAETTAARHWRVRVFGAALTLLAGGCGGSSIPDPAGGGSAGPTPVAATGDERDCLWLLNSQINTLFPDTYANYWVALLAIPPGGAVEFDGRFPHARYMSYNLYDELLQPVDALSDFEIQPHTGSTNPFPAGADRNAAARDYSVRLVAAVPPSDPAQRAANTLYSAQTVGTAQLPFNLAVVFYRVYVPDDGRDATGDGGLPHIRFVMADGSALSGPGACNALDQLSFLIPNLADVPDLLADVPLNTAAFQNLLWLKFFSLQSSEASRVYNTPLGPLVYETVGSPTSGGGGFASNRDNRYIYAAISRQLGDLVAIHARFPDAPYTSDGRSPMPDGDMRYWSLCSNDANTLVSYACLYDEQLLRDDQDRGVIVVSRSADRPDNATPACGVNWLDWGPSDNGLLIYRNMLPLPQTQFPYAIQYVPGPPGQHEAEVMGPYYPYGAHMSRAAFEALGCPVSADALPSVVTPAP